MSASTIDLVFGVTGQTLVFDCPEGRPSSVVSSQLFESGTGDDGTAEVALTGAATIEATPVTTFDADSGVGQGDPRFCYLTTTAGVAIGQRYLATNAYGERDFVEAAAISSGAHVVARQPLENAYTGGDSFVTTRISHALDTTWIADAGNISSAFAVNSRYRWRLVYVVAGKTYVHDPGVDLLRYQGRHDVVGLDVDRRSPGWLDRLGESNREDQGRAVIDEAFEALKFDLYNMATPDQGIRNREAVNNLVKLKAIAMVDRTEQAAAEYAVQLDKLIAHGKTATAVDETGASAIADIRPFWRR